MNALAAKLIGCGVLLVALVAGVMYVRALRAELADANHQLDNARQAIADRDGTISRLQSDAKEKDQQQQQLDNSTGNVTAATSTIRQQTRRILDANPTARAWADTALPDDIARVQASPALTGADDYSAAMPADNAVQAAGDGSAH